MKVSLSLHPQVKKCGYNSKNNRNKSNTTTPVGFTGNYIQNNNTLESMNNLSISNRALINRANKSSQVNFGALGEKERKLISATIMGNFERVEQLLQDETIDVNAIDDVLGCTALIAAAKYGDKDIAYALLQHKDSKGNYDVYVNAADKEGRTALGFASAYGHTEIVNALLQREDINVNATNEDDNTALMLAAENGHNEIVDALLKHKDSEGNYDVDVNKANKEGLTPLMLAAENGHNEIVDALLQKEGIDVYKTDKNGNTALVHAFIGNNIEVIDMMLEKRNMSKN